MQYSATEPSTWWLALLGLPLPTTTMDAALGAGDQHATGVVVDDDAQEVRHVLAALLQAPGDDIALHVVHPRAALGELVGVRCPLERAPAQPGGDDLDRAAALPALRERERESRSGA